MAKDTLTDDRGTATGRTDPDRSDTTRARADDAKDALRAASNQVGEAVETVRTSLPEVARASRGFMDDAMRRIERGSDQQVSAGVTMSLGLAIGMLLGGAPRLLIALALVPVAAMGLVLMDRRAGTRSGSSTPARSS
ncbi:MAG TPA: hypothetical protein VFX65_14180 [Candidatus Limnocylindrales bacterium]|nr:hypothetical protein [Candidatus Limnocylindrales bacterium]